MPKARRRLTIDVSELAERIENCRDDLAWQNLSLSAKIRVLIETSLTQPALEPVPQQPDKSESDRTVLDYLFGESDGKCKRPTKGQIVEFCSTRGLLVKAVAQMVEAKAEDCCVEETA